MSSFGDGRSVLAVNAIQRGFYVDDCLIYVATEKEAIETLTDMHWRSYPLDLMDKSRGGKL